MPFRREIVVPAVLFLAVAAVGLAPGKAEELAPRSTVVGDEVAVPTREPAIEEMIAGDLFKDMKDPAAIYAAACADCHGKNMEGNKAQSLTDGVWQFGARRYQVRDNIQFGLAQLAMPAYDDSLTMDQLNALTDYILSAESKAEPEPVVLPATYTVGDQNVHIETVLDGFGEPWCFRFADEHLALLTDQESGELWQIVDGKQMDKPVANLPYAPDRGTGGLMDVAVGQTYAEDGWVYLCYAHLPDGEGKDVNKVASLPRVVRGHIQDNRWTDEEVILEARSEDYIMRGGSFGGRMLLPPDGYLYVTFGDRFEVDDAQDLTKPNGKIHRVHPDGRIPDDNPFVGQKGVYESIYTLGNRNAQGLALEPATGRIWETEHGPMGGDELNLIQAGHNYGWPRITYGREYDGRQITDHVTEDGLDQPQLYWNPSIAVCGLEFYSGDLFPQWKGQLLVGALKFQQLRRVKIDSDGEVVEEQVILKNFGRVRDVTTGPDGAIYVVLNKPGRVVKLTPAE